MLMETKNGWIEKILKRYSKLCLISLCLKCPYYGFLKITFHAVYIITQLKVNENILQSFKSESATCIKLLSLKRKSRLGIIETSRF